MLIKLPKTGSLIVIIRIKRRNTELTDVEDQDELEARIEQWYRNDKSYPEKEMLDTLVSSGDLIYVHEYTRTDGTKVNGYYRHKPGQG